MIYITVAKLGGYLRNGKMIAIEHFASVIYPKPIPIGSYRHPDLSQKLCPEV